MLNRIFIRLRSKLYFIPVVYSTVFVLLAVLLVYLDNTLSTAPTFLPAFFFTSRSLGSVILSTVSGGLLTMLTITFSIMMVVLTIYGNQLSPRTLQDFLEKRNTQRILGFFIGSLIFSVIQLFAVKPQSYSNGVLSPAAAILLFLLSAILFAYFIHFISKSVQVSLYIQQLVKESSDLIDRKLKIIDDAPEIKSCNMEEYEEILKKNAYEITTPQSGFIQYYDEKKLFDFALRHGVVINCVNMVGTHVLEGDPILQIYGGDGQLRSEEAVEHLRTLVYIGDETNLYEDMGAGAKKLVEIAVRALSPGVNDPGTAVFCIEKIGFLLQKVAKGLEAKVYIDEEENARLIVSGSTFERLLFQHFYQIKHYGVNDLIILDAILGALITISKTNSYATKEQVWRFGRYVISESNLKNYAEVEKKYMRERLYQLSKAANQKINLHELLAD